jgi:hypothetical protein
MHRRLIVVSALLIPGSSMAQEPSDPITEQPTAEIQDAVSDPNVEESTDETPGTVSDPNVEESTDETPDALSPNERAVCAGAAILAAGLGCRAAQLACANTTVLSLGSMLVPCVLVVTMACAGLPASAGAYAARFCR